MTTTVGEARAKMQALYPAHQLWNNPEFVQWRQSVETELAAFNEAGIAIPIGEGGNSAQAAILKACGFKAPETAEESIRIYLTLKSVVTFWKRKLGQIKSQSDNYEALEKKVQNAGRANVDTARRNVVG